MKNLVPYALWIIGLLISLPGSAQEGQGMLTRKLKGLGFENIRISTQGDRELISLENNVYRWETDALYTALDTICAYTPATSQVNIYWLRNDLPQIELKVPVALWVRYRAGKANSEELSAALQVDYKIDEHWKVLKNSSPINTNANKIDLVVYPQFSIQNRELKQIYEIQLNIAPALEISLWKGMLFTGQVIFPLRNDFEVLDIEENVDYRDRQFLYASHEGDYTRPGFITISQDFRLPGQWMGTLATGNFNGHRYGLHAQVNHPFQGNRWSIGAQGGWTGSSHFLQGQWVNGSLNTLSWKAIVGYFYPRYNVQLNLSYGTYLNQDRGFRAECTRHFGATAIGFYAMQTAGHSNGGFRFTVPFPIARQNRKHALRIRAPNYFDSDFNAGYAVYYGKDYETSPRDNSSEDYLQPLFVKNMLTHARRND